MGNKRIYEIAKETDLTSKDIQDRLEQMGITVKSASSSITTEQYDAFRARFSKLFKGDADAPAPVAGKERVVSVVHNEETQTTEKITEKRVSGTVIRRRAKVQDTPPPPPPPKVEPAKPAVTAESEKIAVSAAPQAPVATPPSVAAAPAAPQPPAATPSPQEGGPLLRVVEPRKPDFVPRVEQPVTPPAAPGAPAQGPETAEEAIERAKVAREKEERDKAERRVAVVGRRSLKERQAENDWRETKRMLAKRREFEDTDVLAGAPRGPEGAPRRSRRKRVAGGRKVAAVAAAVPGKKKPIRIEESITVVEMASAMGVKSAELVKKLMDMGVMATANQAIDFDTAGILAHEYEFEVERVGIQEEEVLRKGEDKPEELKSRPPVVTIMGHVDHGKTSLLDKIRTTRVAEGEAGGITQHIGAYHVETKNGPVTFLDTPGHEAFTAMRARGAQATDIVVLVVAADDGVKPQTIEAINHAKAAGVPIVVAVNKIDKPGAKMDQVRSQLSEYELVPEDWGGQTLFVNVSAKTGEGVETLVETLALQAEVLELKANPEKPAQGTVVEARLEKGRGPVTTILVQQGTLRQGDMVVAGQYYGRARALTDDMGKQVNEIGPGMPVEILGLSGVPSAGDSFDAVLDEKLAKQVAGKRAHKLREKDLAASSKISLEQLFARISQGEAKELPLVVKADVQGSVEAVAESLEKLSTPACRVKLIHQATGGITSSDVNLAAASNAIIIGFNVRPDRAASDLAEQQGVQIKSYSIIYELLDDVRAAMEGLLEPERREKVIGHVEVREVYNITKVGKVAGCYVQDGKVTRGCHVRVVRDGSVVYDSKLASLKRFKDDAKEVPAGMECGLSIVDFADVKPGDILEAYEVEEVAVSLESTRQAPPSEGGSEATPPAQ